MNCLNCLNKKGKIIIVILYFLLFINFVYAEDKILNLILIKDESGIRLVDRTISISKIESNESSIKDYKLIVRSFDNSALETVDFGFIDDIAIVAISTPNVYKGEVYDSQDQLLLEIDLSSHIDLGICGDNTCSIDETYETCPQDCYLQRELFSEQETKNGKLLPIILYSAIVFVALLIIVFLVNFLKNNRKEKSIRDDETESQYEPNGMEQQIQDYIQQAKRQGLSNEDIRNELLDAGWPMELIEKNLK